MRAIESRQRKQEAERTRKSLSALALKALESSAQIFGKELKDSEMGTWNVILRSCSDPAIAWAFDNWNRNGKFFPKPSEVLELVHVFGTSPENQVALCGKCENGWIIVNPQAKVSDYKVVACECALAAIQAGKIPTKQREIEHYGKGYHGNDVVWLFKRYIAEKKVNPNVKMLDLMDELDKKRQGGAPEWRRVGGTAARQYQGEPIRDEEVPF